jgi:hypothetical protein
MSETAKTLLYENIGFKPEEYTAVKNITVDKFLKEIPDLKTDGQISAHWIKEHSMGKIDLPYGGHAYDYWEFRKQVLLGQLIKNEMPEGVSTDSITIDEFLRRNIENKTEIPVSEVPPETQTTEETTKEAEIPTTDNEVSEEKKATNIAETSTEKPEGFVYQELDFTPAEFAAIENINLNQLLSQIPEGLDSDEKIKAFFDGKEINLPHSGKYEISEFKKHVLLAEEIRKEMRMAVAGINSRMPTEDLEKISVKQMVEIMSLGK